MTTHAMSYDSGWAFWRPVVLRAPGFPSEQATRLCSPVVAAAADNVADCEDQRSEGWQEYRAAFAAESARLSVIIMEIAQTPRFQFALAWQNHQLISLGIDPMLRRAARSASRNSKQRQKEDVVASYWQRYCLKNDTIGFFGPVGWGFLDDSGQPSKVSAGEGFLASSELFFEAWAVDALAEVIAAEPGMSDWVPPRLVPFVRIDGDRIYRPAGPPITLSPVQQAIVRLIDGVTPACGIADAVAADPALGVTRAGVFEAIDGLRRRRVLGCKLLLPMSTHPEIDLRSFLESVGDPALSGPGLAKLDQFEATRNEVGAASECGDPARFVTALETLDQVFIGLTGTSPNRNLGKAYGGRTLVYHDARRNVDFLLGSEVVEALGPIDLLCQSARWLTYQFELAVRTQFQAIAERLAAQDGWPVNLAAFWFECLTFLHRHAKANVAELVAEFQRRWAEIFRCPLGERRVRYRAADLADAVREAFDAPHSGWSGARYCSPDLMISARDEQAVRDGDFQVVLGEMHLALATLRHHCFVTQHPQLSELLDCLTPDNPIPRLMTVQPKEDSRRLTIRTQQALLRDEDYLVALFDQTVDPARPGLLRAADLSVVSTPDGLRVPVGDYSYDVSDVFSELLTNLIMDKFHLFPDLPHVPRVTIDRMVVSREIWRFPAEQLTFAAKPTEEARYLCARAWRRRTGLPARVFVKVPGETKPFFVDFESPHYVNILAKSARKLQALAGGDPAAARPVIQFSEMLPAMDELWVTDHEGNRYTAEFRVVAVDLRGPVPGQPKTRAL